MKILVILSITFFSLMSFADSISQKKQRRVTQCLGREELNLHKAQKQNYHYHLNQTLIQYFVQLKGVTLKDKFYHQACDNSKNASFKILRIILTHFEKSFEYIPSLYAISSSKGLVEKFVNDLPDILKEFLLHVKKTSPNLKCIEKKSPEILELEDKILHQMGHMPFEKIIWQRRLIEKVLNRFQDPDFFYKNCNYKERK